VAQCGGRGNVARLATAIASVATTDRFSEHFQDMPMMWNFAGPDETEEKLENAGFDDVKTWLQDKPLTPEYPLEFLATVTLGPHLALLAEELRDDFTNAVAAKLDDPLTLDYVRLNLDGTA
jgi:trans-aconitate 2-methyltransferase